MFLNDISDNLIKQIDSKILENKISREDLEQIFSFILSTFKIIEYFDNDKLYEIKSQRINLYLFFIAFIKNYLLEINKYIDNLDLNDEYVSEIKNEISIENNSIEMFLSKNESNPKININDLNKKDNNEILNQIKYLMNLVDNNQKNNSESKVINKLKESINLLEEKENFIKRTVEETIEKRNKYLYYKKLLENRYKEDLNIFTSIKNLEDSIDKEINTIENSLNTIENKLSNIIDINQKLHDSIINNIYPKF